jgi:hypothetical protein
MIRWGNKVLENGNNITVFCYQCGTRKRLFEVTPNLDGVPFRAYYCDDCLTDLKEINFNGKSSRAGTQADG